MGIGDYHLGLDHDISWNYRVIGKFDAFLPCVDRNNNQVINYPPYIKITHKGKSRCFKTTANPDRKGDIYINPAIFPGITLIEVTPKKINSIKFQLHRITLDSSARWAFIGLLMAIIGLTIDGCFAIGKAGVNWKTISNNLMLWLMILSMVLKATGLFIVYLKSLKDLK